MKKLFFTLLLLSLLSSVAWSQSKPFAPYLKKGSKMVNLQLSSLGVNTLKVSFSDAPNDPMKMTRFGLTASAGKVVAPNMMVIALVGFNSIDNDGMAITQYNLAAQGRYYFNKMVYGAAGLGLIGGKIGDEKSNMLDGLLSIGLSVELLPKLMLEPSVAFSAKLAGGNIADSGGVSLSYTQFTLNLGFSYFF
ncbi:MAG: hypothetical protein WC960_01935 [Bacteroidales bacterium]